MQAKSIEYMIDMPILQIIVRKSNLDIWPSHSMIGGLKMASALTMM